MNRLHKEQNLPQIEVSQLKQLVIKLLTMKNEVKRISIYIYIYIDKLMYNPSNSEFSILSK